MKAILNGDSKPRRKNKNKVVKAKDKLAVKSKTPSVLDQELSVEQKFALLNSYVRAMGYLNVTFVPEYNDDDNNDDAHDGDDEIYAGHSDVNSEDEEKDDNFDFDSD